MTKDINKTQLFFLMITLGTIFKVVYLPVILFEVSGRDSWISILLMWIIEFLLIVIIFAIYNLHKEKSVAEIMESTIGKIAKSIILLIITLFSIFKTNFIFSATLKLTVYSLYNNLPWNPFIIPMLILLLYSNMKGLQSISRANQLFGYISLFIIMFSLIMFNFKTELSSLRPMLEFGFSRPLNGLNKYILGTGDYLPCLFFLGRIKPEKGVNKSVLLGALTAFIITMLFSLAFYSFYNNIVSFQTHGDILSDMAKSFRGMDIFLRLDTIIIIFWIIISFFNLIVRNWATKQALSDAFNLKDTTLNKILCSIPMIIVIAAFSFFKFSSMPITSDIFTEWYRWLLVIPIIYVIPLLILILALILKNKEKKNGEHGKQSDTGNGQQQQQESESGQQSEKDNTEKLPKGEKLPT